MDTNNDLLNAINSVTEKNSLSIEPEINNLKMNPRLTLENQKEHFIKSLNLLFKEDVLSQISLADFNTPLSDVLLKLETLSKEVSEEVDIKSPQVPWNVTVKDDDLLFIKLSYNFPNTKLNYVLDKLISFDKFLLSFELNHIDKEVLSICISTEMSKDDFDTNKSDLELKLYTEILNNTQNNQILSDIALNESIEISYDESSYLPITAFIEKKKHLIKVPIAKKGSFHHPEYKILDFSEEVLNNIEENINKDVLGYPIPITYGHLSDSAFKEGELVKVYRDGDVLFGEWEVKSDTYNAVKAGNINFSSAEFFPNYMDKNTGKTIGRTLFGMALTNKPYIPNQPKVLALSNNEIAQSCYFLSQLHSQEVQYNNSESIINNSNKLEVNLKDTNKEKRMSETEKKESEVLSQEQVKLSNDLQILKEQLSEYHTKLSLVESNYQEKLSVQESLNKELQTRIQKYEDRIKEEEINAKLNYLKELQLSESVMEKYSSLIKSGALGESEEIVLSSLAEISQSKNAQLLTQHGMTNGTSNMNDQYYEDPYSKVIEYNKKIVEAKKINTLASLQS